MKIVILSGGSGNDSLVKGLKQLYKDCDVKVIVNAYDNGKSTGVCRQITDTLGVSDIRKNHTRMYKAMISDTNKNYIEFYDNRYNFTAGDELREVEELLFKWDLESFIPYVRNFFARPKSKEYQFQDFSVANIVYSEMYAELGYEKTNHIFCTLLGIDDFVVLNSFDNVFIYATTRDGTVIEDEGDIVEFKNSSNPIVSLDYTNKPDLCILNNYAVELIDSADLIVISTGTFWSSIYPTLQYGDFYRYINNSSAKKIWAINNAEDKDAYGVTSNDFIHHVENLGLDLASFTILENLDAIPSLQQDSTNYRIVKRAMGNSNGKHNGAKYAKAIFELYYDLDESYDSILFDFDDTLWARQKDEKSYATSVKNVEMINKLTNATIISGNSYKSIYKKLSPLFGSDLKNFNVGIWADANSILYHNNNATQYINKLLLPGSATTLCEYLRNTYGLNIEENPAYIKIKPLNCLERQLLVDYLNDYLLEKFGVIDSKAYIRGTTTVDIISSANHKGEVFDYMKLTDKKTLYIGDEFDSGNDKQISEMCTTSINVSSIDETTLLLKILTGEV